MGITEAWFDSSHDLLANIQGYSLCRKGQGE